MESRSQHVSKEDHEALLGNAEALPPQSGTVGKFLEKLEDSTCDGDVTGGSLLPCQDKSRSQIDSAAPQPQPELKAREGEACGPVFVLSEDHFANVLSALTFLLDEVEIDINTLIRVGADAFRNRDLELVRSACAAAMEKNEFHTTIQDLHNHWRELEDIRRSARMAARSGHSPPPLISSVSLRGPVGVASAFDTVLEGIELSLDLFSAQGVQAFESRDFAKVEEACRQSIAILEFHSKVCAVKDHWHSLDCHPKHGDIASRCGQIEGLA